MRGAGEVSGGRILVRAAGQSDADALEAILRDTFESTWRPNVSAPAGEAFLAEDRPARYVARNGLDFHVAEREGEVVGLVHWRDDFVHALHVRSDHARSGVGARLMDLAEAEVARVGFGALRLETDTFNLAAQAFYSTRGYREAARYADQQWNSGLTTLLLVKGLI